jgi:glycosyltransferase involved in cell wall biosynthesis
MRVLHLFSDWKWTGPAEPTVNLCRALGHEGVHVRLACRRPLKGYFQSIWSKAGERHVETTTEFHLNRYMNPVETLQDMIRIGPYVRARGFDLIHCHLSHDHVLGGWSSRISRGRIPVIRTNHKAAPLKRTLGNRWLLRRWTDGLIEFSRRSAQANEESFQMDRKRVLTVEGAVDLDRFDPEKVRTGVRAQLGLQEGELLAGIVARVQRHRRFEVLLEAMAILQERVPLLRLMVLGRGTHMREVAVEPAARLGLHERVIFPGYRGEDYVDYLGAVDIKVFLVPGSDGTCRAVREAMALGKPVVAFGRGMLPEIVEDGRTGFLVEEDPRALAQALTQLAQNANLRRDMGRAAREKALNRFSMAHQAAEVASFYRRIASCGTR